MKELSQGKNMTCYAAWMGWLKDWKTVRFYDLEWKAKNKETKWQTPDLVALNPWVASIIETYKWFASIVDEYIYYRYQKIFRKHDEAVYDI